MTWVQLLAASLGGGGLAGIGGSLLTGLLTRPKVKADAVALLTDSAIKQVNELQERTSAAEREADAARQQMRLLTVEIDTALATLRNWRAAILHPTADLDQLRAMVRTDPGSRTVNGRAL